MNNDEIETVCRIWYGSKWDTDDPKFKVGEKMKEVWRGYARKAIEAIDKVRLAKT